MSDINPIPLADAEIDDILSRFANSVLNELSAVQESARTGKTVTMQNYFSQAEAHRRLVLLLNQARIKAVQLYIDTCKAQGVDPSWGSLLSFQKGQRLAYERMASLKEQPNQAGLGEDNDE